MKKLLPWGFSLACLLGLAWAVSSQLTPTDTNLQQRISIAVTEELPVQRRNIQDVVSKPQTPSEIAKARWEQKREKRMNGWSKPKFDGPDQYAQMQRDIRTREGESTPGYAPNQSITELKKAKQALANLRTEAVSWDSRGPSNVPGRSRAVLPLPSDPQNSWLLGTAAGGIWKTTDAGDTWEHKTDDLPNLATTTLAESQGVIYAGTGEYVGGSIGVNGMGIFRSTDEGETWEELSSTMNDLRFTNINRIIVNPDDANHLVVATSAYNRDRVRFSEEVQTWVMYSKDGGQTWTESFNDGGTVRQVIASPFDFNKQLFAFDNIGIWSSNDAGETWSPSSTGITSLSGRIEIAASPVQEDLYFLSAVGTNSSNGSDLYVSEDGGNSWGIVLEANGGVNQNFLGGQGWYDNTIIAHPYDASIVYVGGVDTWKMQLGGEGEVTEDVIVTEDGTDTFWGFSSFSNVRFFNGGINTPEGITFDELLHIELRFGPGKSQMAHRFTVGGQGPGVPPEGYIYEDYVEIPFEVWDVDNNTQLMVSFRDQAADGAFNLVEENFGDDNALHSREYLFIHNIAYAGEANTDIATNGGHLTNNVYSIFPQLVAGGTWDAANLPESTLSIEPTQVQSKTRQTTIITDAYGQYGGPNGYTGEKEQFNEGIHPDQHYLWVLKDDPELETFRLLITNDGGIYKTRSEADPGVDQGDWFYAGSGLVTGQYHGAAKMPGANVYIGGLQDNGTWRSPLENTNPNASTLYDPMFGGDGFDVIWNNRDENLVMGGSQFNGFARSSDKGLTWNGIPDPGFGGASFFSPLGNSRSNPDVVFTVSATGIWRSDDFGLNWESIPVEDQAAWDWGGGIPQIKASDAYNQVVWAGKGMGETARIMVSDDGGISFTAANGYDGEPLGDLSGFATHPTEPFTAYALFSFAEAPKVVRTTDLGETWEDISGFEGNSVSDRGFPDVAVYDLVVMPHDPNTIWVGTEIGIVESNDNGASWHFLDSDLPAAPVFDMKIADQQIVIGTHGRGIWSTTIEEIPNVALQLPPVITEATQGEEDQLTVSINLRSAYDSTQVYVNDTYLGSVTNQGEFNVDITDLPLPGFYDVQVVGYSEELPYSSNVYQAVMYSDSDVLDSYTTDFEGEGVQNDFILSDIEIRSETGFEGKAAHTPHPYLDQTNHTMMLKQPIRVAAEGDAVLLFDEVAIVEPGTDGTVFGDAQFWDYAVVEASFNGASWFPLADGYDARATSAWSAAYGNSEAGTSTMIRTNRIDLSDELNEGEIVFIRFRLFADQNTVGWGWMIDNLYIQSNRPINVPVTEISLTVTAGESVGGKIGEGASDPDGDAIVVNPPTTELTLGSVTVLPSGTFTYQAGDAAGEESFICEVCDDRATPSCVNVTVNITVEEGAVTGYNEEVAQNKLAVQAYPNPASEATTIRYFLPQGGDAEIEILDLSGKLYKSWNVTQSKGQHDMPASLEGLPQGLYLLRINHQNGEYVSKLSVK